MKKDIAYHQVMKRKQSITFIVVNLVFWIILILLVYYRVSSSWVWILFLGVWFYVESHFEFKPVFWLVYFLVTVLVILLILSL